MMAFAGCPSPAAPTRERPVNDTTERLVDLCGHLREVVLPSLGQHAARDHAGIAVGGDVTFGIDELAEKLLVEYMRDEPVSYTHLRAHETRHDLVCRLLL